MAFTKKADKTKEPTGPLELVELDQTVIDIYVLGKTPFICNAASEKLTHEMLLPYGRKTAFERATTLKHDPRIEFRSSAYKYRNDSQLTRIYFLSSAFKRAAMTATLEMDSATKASISRLVQVVGEHTEMFGIPQLRMDLVRSAGADRKPDIRTRACLGEWAAKLTVEFTGPKLSGQTVGNLFQNAGKIVGVGDYRVEKGAGNYGQFVLVNEDDERWNRIVETCGREAQDRAFEEAATYNEETAELLSWYDAELVRRAAQGKVTGKVAKGARLNGKPAVASGSTEELSE